MESQEPEQEQPPSTSPGSSTDQGVDPSAKNSDSESNQPTKGGAERRRHERKNAFWRGVLQTKEHRYECRSRNISISGALVTVPYQLQAGQVVLMQLSAYHNGKSHPLKIKAKIVRGSFAPDGYNIALNFIEPEAPHLIFLANYCSKKS